jgi:hypothetical protein
LVPRCKLPGRIVNRWATERERGHRDQDVHRAPPLAGPA